MSVPASTNYILFNPATLANSSVFSQNLSNVLSNSETNRDALRQELNALATVLQGNYPEKSQLLFKVLNSSDISALASHQAELVEALQDISPEIRKAAAEKLASLMPANSNIPPTRFQSNAAALAKYKSVIAANDNDVPISYDPPQWLRRIDMDDATLNAIEAFPGRAQQTWEQEGANPVVFGLNHLKWWMGLIQQDAGKLGADAIAQGGKILFGRWQEKVTGQQSVENQLKVMAQAAKLTLHTETPTTEAWWRPMWEKVLSTTASSEEKNQQLVSILEEVRKDSPGLAEEWLTELAVKDFDRSEAIREAMEEKDAQTSEETTNPDDISDQWISSEINQELESLKALAINGDFETFNANLAVLYGDAYVEENVAEAIAQLRAMKLALDGLDFSLTPIAATSPSPITLQEYEAQAAPLPSNASPASFLITAPDDLQAYKAELELLDDFDGNTQFRAYDKAVEDRLGKDFMYLDGYPTEELAVGYLAIQGRWDDALKEIQQFQSGSGLSRGEAVGLLSQLLGGKLLETMEALLKELAHRGYQDAPLMLQKFQAAWFPPSAPKAVEPQHSPSQSTPKVIDPQQYKPQLIQEARKVAASLKQKFENARYEGLVIDLSDLEVSFENLGLKAEHEELYAKVLELGGDTDTSNFEDIPTHILKIGKMALLDQWEEVVRAIQQLPDDSQKAEALFLITSSFFSKRGDGLEYSGSKFLKELAKREGRKIANIIDWPNDSWTIKDFKKQLIEKAKQTGERLSKTLEANYEKELQIPILYTYDILHNLKSPASKQFDEIANEMQHRDGLIAKTSWDEKLGKDPIERLGENGKMIALADTESLLICKMAIHGKLTEALAAVDELTNDFQKAETLYLLTSLITGSLSESPLALLVKKELADRSAYENAAKLTSQTSRSSNQYFATLLQRDPKTIPEQYQQFIPNPKDIILFPRFQQMLDEVAYLMTAPDRIAVRFFGPPGTSKTTVPEMIAEKMGIPLLRFPFSKRTDPSDLEGLWTREEVNGELVPVFKEGVPTVAMEHGFHLVLDEPDLARPGVLAYLNNITAPGEFAYVRKQNGGLVKIPVHPDYRVYATENGVREIGREEHGKDFLRRFVHYYVGPWSKAEVTQVLSELYENYGGVRRWDHKTTELIAYFHDTMSTLAKGMEDVANRQSLPPLGSGIGQTVEFTPRSVLRLAYRLVASGPLTAESLSRAIRAEYILPLADVADRDLVWTQAQAIFRPLAEQMGWFKDATGKPIGLRSELNTFATVLKDVDPATSQSLSNLLNSSNASGLASHQDALVEALQKISPETLKAAAAKLTSLSPSNPPQPTQFQSSAAAIAKAKSVITGNANKDTTGNAIGATASNLLLLPPNSLSQPNLFQSSIAAALAEEQSVIAANAGNAIGPEQISQPTLESISQKYLGGRKIEREGNFVWTPQAIRLADEILWNRSLGIDVMLLGEAGEGKTELPQQIAKLLGTTYYQKTMSSETDEEDLVGGIGRINGKIGFIPDIVTLGTQHGGIVHLDEYLLADTGKLEGIMNPLMDATKALILKNPYRVIPRHKNTFFILSSNPPFGEYAERNEHSGAAMSRVAPIALYGDFAMQSQDRSKILREWLDRPVKGKKKALNEEGPSPLAPLPRGEGEKTRNWIAPGSRNSIYHLLLELLGQEAYLPMPVHAEIQQKFKLPEKLTLDVAEMKWVQMDANGNATPIASEIQNALKKYADYLTRRTQADMSPLTQKVFKILYSLSGSHQTSLGSKQIILNLADLLNQPLAAALGVGKHEWAHAVIDRPSEIYDAHEVGRLFANVVGDPRMNEYAGSLRQDFAEQIQVLNDEIWPEQFDAKRIENFKAALPHEQFAYAVIYYWRFGKIMPWIEHPKVIAALEQALPLLKPAFTLFPESLQDHHVDAAADKFYKILDQAYPVYKELLPESAQEIMKKLEQGEDPEELARPPLQMLGIPTPGNAPAAPQPQNKPEPSPATSSEGIIEIEDADIIPWTENDPKASDTKPTSPEEDQVPITIVEPQTGSTPDSPPQDLKGLALKIIAQRAGQLADQFEPRDPQAFEGRKAQIAVAKKNAEPSENKDPKEPQENPAKPLSSSEIQKIEVERQVLIKEQLQNDLFRRMLPSKAVRLANRLKRVLPPENPTYLEGFYTTGKRMDRRKAMEDSIRPVSDGKMMLRRMRPGDMEANLVLVSDVSTSLKHAVENTLRGSAAGIYLSEQLKINYGEILFGSTVRIAKPLGKPHRSYPKKNEHLNLKQQAFEDSSINGSTNIREPLALALKWIHEQKANHNFILLITDGDENVVTTDPKTGKPFPTLTELKEAAKKAGVHLLVLAMGDAKKSVPKIFDADQYRFIKDDGSDIPDQIIGLFEAAHKTRLPSVRSKGL